MGLQIRLWGNNNFSNYEKSVLYYEAKKILGA